MQELADPASSPQVIGAIWAASIAAGIGAINVVVTIWQGHLTRQATARKDAREQWWTRFSWAAEKVSNPQTLEDRNLAATVLQSLSCVDWIQPEDQELIDYVLEDYVLSEVTDDEAEEASREQDNQSTHQGG